MFNLIRKKIKQNAFRKIPRELLKAFLSGIGLVLVKKTTFMELENTSHKLNEFYVRNCSAIFHVGANIGEERFEYKKFHKKVYWFEANLEIFNILQKNLQNDKNSFLYNVCLSDKNEITDFWIANNQGQSSSLKEPVKSHIHNQMVSYKKEAISTRRFDSIFSMKDIPNNSHLVLDVQGSELEVLLGFGNLITKFNSIFCEVTVGLSPYKKSSQYQSVESFLQKQHFLPLITPKDNFHGNVIFVKSNI